VDSAIEVRYAGVVVGRATQVKDWTAGGAFIGFTEPLPTGTSIELRGENIAQPARVEEVLESSDASVAGMRVSFVSSSAAAAPPVAVAAPPVAAVAPPVASTASPVEAAPSPSAAPAAPPLAAAPPSASASPTSPAPSSPPEPAAPQQPQPPQQSGGGKRKRRR